jgi:hypothetical protein
VATETVIPPPPMVQVIKIGSHSKFINIFKKNFDIEFSFCPFSYSVPSDFKCAFSALLYCIHLVQFEYHFNNNEFQKFIPSRAEIQNPSTA